MRRATLALTCLLFFGSGLAADRPFLVQPTWRKYHVWETTLHVTVPRAKAAPKIDGTLDDACWKDALRLSDFAGHKAQRYASMPSELLLTYDDTNLYVAFRCREEQIEKLRLARAREMGEGHVWKDDCVEIFIAPQMPGPKPGDTADVFHFIGTPRGAREDWRYLFGRTPAAPRLTSIFFVDITCLLIYNLFVTVLLSTSCSTRSSAFRSRRKVSGWV